MLNACDWIQQSVELDRQTRPGKRLDLHPKVIKRVLVLQATNIRV